MGGTPSPRSCEASAELALPPESGRGAALCALYPWWSGSLSHRWLLRASHGEISCLPAGLGLLCVSPQAGLRPGSPKLRRVRWAPWTEAPFQVVGVWERAAAVRGRGVPPPRAFDTEELAETAAASGSQSRAVPGDRGPGPQGEPFCWRREFSSGCVHTFPHRSLRRTDPLGHGLASGSLRNMLEGFECLG